MCRAAVRRARPGAVRRAGCGRRHRADARVDERGGAAADARDRHRSLLVALAAGAVEEGRDVGQHARARRAARSIAIGDTVLVRARPAGPACHTGTTTCFFTRDDGTDGRRRARRGGRADRRAARADPRGAARCRDRARRATRARCSTRACRRSSRRSPRRAASSRPSCPAGDDDKVVHETADLLFHVMVGLTARRIPIERVFAELARRFGTSGHVEKAASRVIDLARAGRWPRSARSRTTRIAPSSARCPRRSRARSPTSGR